MLPRWPHLDPCCVLSCFEEGMYIQKTQKGEWELKLDVATVVKAPKPEDELHMRGCKGCEVGPIRGPCYAANPVTPNGTSCCQLCYDKLDEEEKVMCSRCDPANIGPQLLTEGSVEGEDDFAKLRRDISFPLAIMEHAYKKETQIEVTKAQASVPEDFTRIINSINGVKELECVPDLSHENCKEVR